MNVDYIRVSNFLKGDIASRIAYGRHMASEIGLSGEAIEKYEMLIKRVEQSLTREAVVKNDNPVDVIYNAVVDLLTFEDEHGISDTKQICGGGG